MKSNRKLRKHHESCERGECGPAACGHDRSAQFFVRLVIALNWTLDKRDRCKPLPIDFEVKPS